MIKDNINCLYCDDSIGEIPENWYVGKVKYLFDRKKEKSAEKDPTVLSLARAGVKIRDISNNEGQLASSYEGYNPVEPYDLLLNPMDLYSGANCSISYEKGVISPAYFNLRAKANVNPRYYDYFFKTQYWTMAMFAHGRGVSFDNRWTLNYEILKNIKVPVPPYEIQNKISDYLDKEISKIDCIITEAEKSIQDYRKWKLAIISETVTKGLNPDVEMKDSGVEQIGKIPIHWSRSKIKYLHDGLTDGTHGTYERLKEGRMLLSSKNVRENFLEIGDNESLISEEDYKSITESGFPKKGDILLCCIGASIGRCIVYELEETMAFQRSVIFIRPKKKMLSKMMRYNMLANSTLIQEKLLANQSAQPGLYQGAVSEIYLTVPPLDEQKKIIQVLDEKCGLIDSMIEKKQTLINNLEEYKRNFIFEIITGKRKVV